jgi:hypothetical protein
MLSRRGVMNLIAAGTAVAISKSASACERDEPTKDKWGSRLKEFFRSGDVSLIRGHLGPEVTLVTFSTYYFGPEDVVFKGPNALESALVKLRGKLARPSSAGPVVFKSAQLTGSGNEGGTNKITPVFDIEKEVTTSCGPTTFPAVIDLMYESDGVEPGDDSLPPLRRFAVLPPISSQQF